MRVELLRVRVKPGKSARVDEWLKMLNDDMKEVLQTLDREQMKLESRRMRESRLRDAGCPTAGDHDAPAGGSSDGVGRFSGRGD